MKLLCNRWLLVATLLFTGVAHAAYPDHSIHLVVPFAPGGGTDILARVIADKVGKALGSPVIVDNKPGAGGTIGTDFVVKSRPDGYTLLMGTNATMALATGLYRDLPYDPVTGLVPIASVASGPSILVVNASLPPTDVASFIAYAKAHPGELNYGSAGNGSQAHIATAQLNQLAGISTVHVPFKGGAAATQELVAGRLQFMIAGPVETVPLIEAKRVRALAITTTKRFPGLPALPTLAEAGVPGYEISNWFGVFAPAGTPPEIVNLLAARIQDALRGPEIAEAFVKQGVEPMPMGPDTYAPFVRAEILKWSAIVRSMNIRVD